MNFPKPLDTEHIFRYLILNIIIYRLLTKPPN